MLQMKLQNNMVRRYVNIALFTSESNFITYAWVHRDTTGLWPWTCNAYAIYTLAWLIKTNMNALSWMTSNLGASLFFFLENQFCDIVFLQEIQSFGIIHYTQVYPWYTCSSFCRLSYFLPHRFFLSSELSFGSTTLGFLVGSWVQISQFAVDEKVFKLKIQGKIACIFCKYLSSQCLCRDNLATCGGLYDILAWRQAFFNGTNSNTLHSK